MTSRGKRLSIFSLPEVQELHSVPRFSAHEREYFFALTDEEYAAVNRLNSYRNRIHLFLMLGCFKVKPVCLVYGWKDIAEDYRYVAERYFPLASKKNKNIDRQTRSRLCHTVFNIENRIQNKRSTGDTRGRFTDCRNIASCCRSVRFSSIN